MKSAVLFFLATAFAVGISFPVSSGEVGEDDPPPSNITEVELPLSNVTEPLVDDDNDTDISGDFVITNNQPPNESSGSEEPAEEKVSVRSLTEDAPVIAESGSGVEVNVTGSAIEELPIDELEIEEEEEKVEGEIDDESDVAEPEEGEEEQDDTK